MECCRPVDEFEWYAVGKEVGNVKNQGVQLLRPALHNNIIP